MAKLVTLILFSILSISRLISQDINEEMQVNLIELEVKVLDWNNKFVSGLSKDDFIVKESGNRIKVDDITEVNLINLPEEEKQAYRSRLMLLFDFNNTNYAPMRIAFDQAKNYFATKYSGQHEVGVAVKAGGIYEIQGFTNEVSKVLTAIEEAKRMYLGSRYKSEEARTARRANQELADQFGAGLNMAGNRRPSSEARGDQMESLLTSETQVNRHQVRRFLGNTSNYYRGQVQILGEYLRYLGAYSGKKNLIMISGAWGTRNQVESAINRDDTFSIRDIQSIAIFNKVAINTVNIQSADFTSTLNAVRHVDQAENMSYATGGSFTRGLFRNLEKALNITIDKQERYYRIRYYSDNTGDRYRRVHVTAKGFWKTAHTVPGYYPKRTPQTADYANAEIRQLDGNSYRLNMGTEWLHWSSAGFKKKRADILMATRLLDEFGRVLAEKVETGTMTIGKSGKSYEKPDFTSDVALTEQAKGTAAKMEVLVSDLSTGKQVRITQAL